nr:hypothetical protein [Vibrio vulnificus]
MIKSLCGSFCIACLHPLTRRYMFKRKLWKSYSISLAITKESPSRLSRL